MRTNIRGSKGRAPKPAGSEETVRLRIALSRLARRLRQQDADLDVTMSQASALAVIAGRGPITIGELASVEKVRPPTMTRVVARLEEQRLIERQVDADDRRVTRVVITPTGTYLLDESRARRGAYLESKLAELDPADRIALLAALPVLELLADGD